MRRLLPIAFLLACSDYKITPQEDVNPGADTGLPDTEPPRRPGAEATGFVDLSGVHRAIRERFSGAYLANGGYLAESGRAAITAGHADALLYGAVFLANPDLPERFRRGAALNAPQRETFFGGDAAGYVDYPALAD